MVSGGVGMSAWACENLLVSLGTLGTGGEEKPIRAAHCLLCLTLLPLQRRRALLGSLQLLVGYEMVASVRVEEGAGVGCRFGGAGSGFRIEGSGFRVQSCELEMWG